MRLGEGAGFDWVSLEKVFECDLAEKPGKDLKIFLQLINGKQNSQT